MELKVDWGLPRWLSGKESGKGSVVKRQSQETRPLALVWEDLTSIRHMPHDYRACAPDPRAATTAARAPPACAPPPNQPAR